MNVHSDITDGGPGAISQHYVPLQSLDAMSIAELHGLRDVVFIVRETLAAFANQPRFFQSEIDGIRNEAGEEIERITLHFDSFSQAIYETAMARKNIVKEDDVYLRHDILLKFAMECGEDAHELALKACQAAGDVSRARFRALTAKVMP